MGGNAKSIVLMHLWQNGLSSPNTRTDQENFNKPVSFSLRLVHKFDPEEADFQINADEDSVLKRFSLNALMAVCS